MHHVGNDESTNVKFEVATAGQLPEGRACHLTESEGRIHVLVRPTHGERTRELCDQLTELHATILGQARWVQTPVKEPDRVERSARGLGVAECSWRLVSPDKLPRGHLCMPVEFEKNFTWLIRRDCASAELCAEMTVYLNRIVGDGLWRQRWDG